jgi:hypothetical protein
MIVFTWQSISNSDDLKALFIPNREGRMKLFLRNEKSSQKYRKNNNADRRSTFYQAMDN